MKHRRYWVVPLAALVLVGAVWAVAGAGASTGKASKTKVTLQLKWVTQAQFAGYYAAKAKGYYDEEGLDVNIKIGGPSITPGQVVLGKQGEVGVDWLPSLLASRGNGQGPVNIPPGFRRRGQNEVN